MMLQCAESQRLFELRKMNLFRFQMKQKMTLREIHPISLCQSPRHARLRCHSVHLCKGLDLWSISEKEDIQVVKESEHHAVWTAAGIQGVGRHRRQWHIVASSAVMIFVAEIKQEPSD